MYGDCGERWRDVCTLWEVGWRRMEICRDEWRCVE